MAYYHDTYYMKKCKLFLKITIMNIFKPNDEKKNVRNKKTIYFHFYFLIQVKKYIAGLILFQNVILCKTLAIFI